MLAAVFLFCVPRGADKFIKVYFPDGRSVTAELAVTEAERARGLMFREKIAFDQGMLFLMPGEDYHAFWMKNTLISLDILWLDKDNYSNIIMVPNFNVVNAVEKAYQDAWEQNDQQSSFRSAKINFYKDAISLLYNYGNMKKAAEFYAKLRKEEPGAHRLPLDEFVMKEWAEDVRDASVKQATDQISGLIYQSCLYLALGDDESAIAHERMARYLYNSYMKAVDGIEERVGLPSYAQMKQSIVEFCMKSFPPALGAILQDRLAQEAAAQGSTQLPNARTPIVPGSGAILPLPAAK